MRTVTESSNERKLSNIGRYREREARKMPERRKMKGNKE